MFVSAAAGHVVFFSDVVPEYLRRKVYIYRSIFTGLRAPASRARVHAHTDTVISARTNIIEERNILYSSVRVFIFFFIVTKVYTNRPRPSDSRDLRRRRTDRTRPIDAHAAGALNDRRRPRILYLSFKYCCRHYYFSSADRFPIFYCGPTKRFHRRHYNYIDRFPSKSFGFRFSFRFASFLSISVRPSSPFSPSRRVAL